MASFATSYIPTLASQVTRTADVATITGANFSQWYNQSEGTFVVEASAYALSSSYAVLSANSGSINNRVQINASTTTAAVVTDATAVQANITGDSFAQNTPFKRAFAYAANDFALCTNGGTVGADTSGTVPSNLNQLVIGAQLSSANFLDGHIRSIRYYPTRLSNAQLQALTA